METRFRRSGRYSGRSFLGIGFIVNAVLVPRDIHVVWLRLNSLGVNLVGKRSTGRIFVHSREYTRTKNNDWEGGLKGH